MRYDFDQIVSRKNTFCVKYDGIEEYKNGLKQIPLMIADMDFKTAPAIIKAMHKVADYGMYGYNSYLVNSDYRKSIQRWFYIRHGWQVNEKDIFFSNGTIEALKCAIQTFSKVGDGVIVCRPVYGHFTDVIRECYRVVDDSHLIQNKDGYYEMDFKDFEEKCAKPQNRIFILCNPHNPIGRVWTPEELQKMQEICLRNRVLMISDEVHGDIVRKNVSYTPLSLAVKDKSNIIVLTALNKTFNLAGMQCSNVIIEDEDLQERFIKNFGMRQPTPFAIAATIAAYTEGEEWVDELNEYIDKVIDWVLEFLKREMPKVQVVKPEGTYCMWLDFSNYGISDEEIHRRIYDQAGVIMQDGIVHDPKYGSCKQRICIPAPLSVIKEAMYRVKSQFEEE